MSKDISQRITLGREAGRLLADPLFNGVLNTMLKGTLESLMNSDVGSDEAAAAHSDMKSYDRIKQHLMAIKNDGVMAEKEMKKNSG